MISRPTSVAETPSCRRASATSLAMTSREEPLAVASSAIPTTTEPSSTLDIASRRASRVSITDPTSSDRAATDTGAAPAAWSSCSAAPLRRDSAVISRPASVAVIPSRRRNSATSPAITWRANPLAVASSAIAARAASSSAPGTASVAASRPPITDAISSASAATDTDAVSVTSCSCSAAPLRWDSAVTSRPTSVAVTSSRRRSWASSLATTSRAEPPARTSSMIAARAESPTSFWMALSTASRLAFTDLISPRSAATVGWRGSTDVPIKPSWLTAWLSKPLAFCSGATAGWSPSTDSATRSSWPTAWRSRLLALCSGATAGWKPSADSATRSS